MMPTSWARRGVAIRCKPARVAARRWLMAGLAAASLTAGSPARLGTSAAMPLVDGASPVRAELLVDAQTVQAGDTGRVGVRLRIGRGWHVYAPEGYGVSAPTRVQLNSPQAYVGTPQAAAPGLFSQFDGASALGYTDEVTFVAPYTVASDTGGRMEVRASVSLLSCKVLCVPGRFELRAAVPIGRVRRQASAAVLAALAAASPAGAAAPKAAPPEPPATAPSKGNHLAPAAAAPPGQAERTQAIERANEAALDSVLHAREADTAAAQLPPPGAAPIEEELPGAGDIASAPVPVLVPVSAPLTDDGVPSAAPSLLGMLCAALLGGLILNAMPCVLPVLAMKALTMAAAHTTPAAARRHARAYLAGTVGSMVALGAAAIGLRELGHAAGWGFQMQHPAFLASIAVALTLFCASSFDAVSFSAPVDGLAQWHGRTQGPLRGVLEGALAVLVATPCSAPFLGSAAAFALTQPAAMTLLCFGAIGTGLASPFVVLAYVPAARRLLPRPGPWMANIKGALGFALLGTLAWLVWLYAAVAGVPALAPLLGVLWLAAAGTACVGKLTAERWDLTPWAMALWVVVLAMTASEVLPPSAGLDASAAATSARGHASTGPTGAPAYGPGAEEPDPAAAGHAPGAMPTSPWSEAAVQRALAAGRPVLVEFTAEWCVTCKYNERQLQDPAVQQAMQRAGVQVFVADWTRPNDAIYAKLQAHGRAGVPMALLYDPRRPNAPTRLSEVLRVGSLLQQLRALPPAAGSPVR